MKSEEIVNRQVVDIASGTTIGIVTGMLIDSESKQMVALQIGGGLLTPPNYVPFESIKAMENDVVMVTSESSVVGRASFKGAGRIDNLIGRNVLTVDGMELGTIHDYSVDIASGEITSISVATDTAVLGGLWKSAGEPFDIPR
ncbi:MAG TPA: PRC-barrel domain-containing protein, partial [Armatimonadota bacterium]